MAEVTVGRWGNNLVVSVPDEIARAVNLHEGDRVDVNAVDGEILIRPGRLRVTLDELFRGRTPEEWRAAYADAHDWGPDRGREVLPDELPD